MPAATTKRALLRLRLYVAGNAQNSVRAIANVRAICAQHFPGTHELEIVDMLKSPRRAFDDRIIVTPTLLKLSAPTGRVLGDLSDTKQFLLVLERE